MRVHFRGLASRQGGGEAPRGEGRGGGFRRRGGVEGGRRPVGRARGGEGEARGGAEIPTRVKLVREHGPNHNFPIVSNAFILLLSGRGRGWK